ncbi:MAG TPA: glycosyltransferase [Candidatus Ventricola intestinavium]|nr:glycosyltransferase [Candidatus Ventricola intestinavium]
MISVIVIGKNEGERLTACLESVQEALSVLAHEVLYVDSCSTDDSMARAKAMGARCYLLAQTRTTAGLGRFVGAREARGEYLLFLDGDMRLCPGFAERALMAMAARGYDGVCGIREDVYLRGGRVVSRRENYYGCTQERIAPEFGGALMIRAEALEGCGGWSTDTIACEEAELHARLNDAGCRIAEIPVPMIVHTDTLREGRGVLGVLFSRRRLGEGQAFRCAAAKGKAKAYMLHEKKKFLFYALDILCLLLVLLLHGAGWAVCLLIQSMQLGFLIARGRGRAFVSQKLFFFAFPLGLCTYRVRSRAYAAV